MDDLEDIAVPADDSGSSSVTFDAASLLRFARESHDLNPLHMDEGYAHKSAFGQRVVFGALGGLACLDRLPDLPGWELERIDLEFRHPMFMGVDYRLHVERTTDGRTVVDLRDGALTVLRLTADFRAAEAATAAEPAVDFPSAVKPRALPADPTDETLRAGLTLDGFYQTKLPSSRFPQAQLLLRLCSYLTGMEAPGRRALFLRCTLRIPAGAPPIPGRTVKYRLATQSYDAEFGLLSSALEVWTETGLLAVGDLKAFARKDLSRVTAPARPDVVDESLKGKTALVIGGSRGLGARIVEALVWRGCHVAVNFLSSRDEAEALAETAQERARSGDAAARRRPATRLVRERPATASGAVPAARHPGLQRLRPAGFLWFLGAVAGDHAALRRRESGPGDGSLKRLPGYPRGP